LFFVFVFHIFLLMCSYNLFVGIVFLFFYFVQLHLFVICFFVFELFLKFKSGFTPPDI